MRKFDSFTPDIKNETPLQTPKLLYKKLHFLFSFSLSEKNIDFADKKFKKRLLLKHKNI